MSTLNPLSAAEPWDLVAEGYAAEAKAVMAPFSQRAAQLVTLKDFSRVLDLAAGPGTLTLEIANLVGTVTAVDFSETMSTALRTQVSKRELHNVDVLTTDGQELPLADNCFDVAFSLFGWMFFPDRAKGLAELKRVLVPGGSLIVSSWAPFDRSPLTAAIFGAMRAADPSIPEHKADPTSLENPEVLAQELRDGGFGDVTVQPHTVSVPFESTDKLWTAMARSSAPLVMMRKAVGEEAWAGRVELARAYLARELKEKRSLDVTAWLALGKRV
jgi:SAM-dependent methyltransferase